MPFRMRRGVPGFDKSRDRVVTFSVVISFLFMLFASFGFRFTPTFFVICLICLAPLVGDLMNRK